MPFIANSVVQAQYFKDPREMPQYLAHNPFLPDINNERPNKTALYATNLASLQRLVLFQFEDDVVVVPKESSWFGVLDPTTGNMLPMEVCVQDVIHYCTNISLSGDRAVQAGLDRAEGAP